jgi:hypothetical protein
MVRPVATAHPIIRAIRTTISFSTVASIGRRRRKTDRVTLRKITGAGLPGPLCVRIAFMSWRLGTMNLNSMAVALV